EPIKTTKATTATAQSQISTAQKQPVASKFAQPQLFKAETAPKTTPSSGVPKPTQLTSPIEAAAASIMKGVPRKAVGTPSPTPQKTPVSGSAEVKKDSAPRKQSGEGKFYSGLAAFAEKFDKPVGTGIGTGLTQVKQQQSAKPSPLSASTASKQLPSTSTAQSPATTPVPKKDENIPAHRLDPERRKSEIKCDGAAANRIKRVC
ncbi:unnamed protein product, partial [Anisakis simplex]|uniref:PEST proteolytic signal-containing nuclear protein n=1 Tax=Anisakis simplex TaxID=6269 RepID=A0A0M3J6Y1_ANISI